MEAVRQEEDAKQAEEAINFLHLNSNEPSGHKDSDDDSDSNYNINLRSGVIFFFLASLLLWLEREKTNA